MYANVSYLAFPIDRPALVPRCLGRAVQLINRLDPNGVAYATSCRLESGEWRQWQYFILIFWTSELSLVKEELEKGMSPHEAGEYPAIMAADYTRDYLCRLRSGLRQGYCGGRIIMTYCVN